MKSHSQAGQDLWVDEMLEHKTGGHYVDLGCNHESFHSNTYALETERDWSGLLVDVVGGCENRNGKFVKADAANPDEVLRYAYSQLPPVSDYLSLDCDDASFKAFGVLPWKTVTWRAMTIETDVYRKGIVERDTMRAALRQKGYILVCGDVIVEWPQSVFVPYEDWFCHPDLVNPDQIRRFRCHGKYWGEILKMP